MDLWFGFNIPAPTTWVEPPGPGASTGDWDAQWAGVLSVHVGTSTPWAQRWESFIARWSRSQKPSEPVSLTTLLSTSGKWLTSEPLECVYGRPATWQNHCQMNMNYCHKSLQRLCSYLPEAAAVCVCVFALHHTNTELNRGKCSYYNKRDHRLCSLCFPPLCSCHFFFFVCSCHFFFFA